MGTLYRKTNSNNWVFSYRKDSKNIRIMGEEYGLNNLPEDIPKSEIKKLKHQFDHPGSLKWSPPTWIDKARIQHREFVQIVLLLINYLLL